MKTLPRSLEKRIEDLVESECVEIEYPSDWQEILHNNTLDGYERGLREGAKTIALEIMKDVAPLVEALGLYAELKWSTEYHYKDTKECCFNVVAHQDAPTIAKESLKNWNEKYGDRL